MVGPVGVAGVFGMDVQDGVAVGRDSHRVEGDGEFRRYGGLGRGEVTGEDQDGMGKQDEWFFHVLLSYGLNFPEWCGAGMVYCIAE